MKKKHEIKTIDDIKYCEENGLIVFSDKICSSWEFLNNVWCQCVGKFVCLYNVTLNIKEYKLFYYEEQEQQEATEDDENTLCVFWRGDSDKYYGVLDYIQSGGDFKMLGGCSFPHCRRLSPSEVAELTGYKVEEK